MGELDLCCVKTGRLHSAFVWLMMSLTHLEFKFDLVVNDSGDQ